VERAHRGAALAFDAKPAVPVDNIAQKIVSRRLAPRISPLYGLRKTVLSRPRVTPTDALVSDFTVIIAGCALGLTARILAISSS
jgi:hypothetical protein